jgi:hypothetical protein
MELDDKSLALVLFWTVLHYNNGMYYRQLFHSLID